MRLKLSILIILFIFSKNTYAQNTKTEMAIYNIGINSVFSGIGALINKQPNQKWHNVLLKGMAQGAVGGYFIYESKNLVGKINNNKSWEYGWYGKFVNSIGTSIVENASSNRNFWEKWHINFGFNRLEFYTKDKFKVKYKIMPISFILTLSTAIRNKFEFKRTLQTGEFIFSKNNIENRGITLGNIILVDRKAINSYDLFSHEIIHIYQYYDYNFVNAYLNKPFNKWNHKSKTFNKINDIFYLDLQAPVLRGLYLLENINRKCYYDNFYENEAGFYSRTKICN